MESVHVLARLVRCNHMTNNVYGLLELPPRGIHGIVHGSVRWRVLNVAEGMPQTAWQETFFHGNHDQ